MMPKVAKIRCICQVSPTAIRETGENRRTPSYAKLFDFILEIWTYFTLLNCKISISYRTIFYVFLRQTFGGGYSDFNLQISVVSNSEIGNVKKKQKTISSPLPVALILFRMNRTTDLRP